MSKGVQAQSPAKGLVLPSFEPIKVARTVLTNRFTTENKLPGMWRIGGVFYEWTGNSRWTPRTDDEVFALVAEVLEDAVQIEYKDNVTINNRYAPTVKNVTDVVRFLAGIVTAPTDKKPSWLGVGGKDQKDLPDALDVVAFQDVLIDVPETAKKFAKSGTYDFVLVPRDERFFGLAVLPFKFDPHAKAHLWEKCMGEWLDKDKDAIELRERFYGSCLRARRRDARALLEYDKPRSGKGTGPRILKRLIGEPAFFGASMHDLVGDFGTEGLEESQVMVVSELGDLTSREGERFSSLFRAVMGWDTIRENRKNVKHRSVEYRCAVILQGHKIPEMPDDQRGVTSKLLPLRYRNTWIDKEDTDLDGRLAREDPGIALRWLKALVRLEAEADSAKRWPMPESSRMTLKQIAAEMNPADAFLASRFSPLARGFVSNEAVRKLRREWEREAGLRLRHKDKVPVSDQHLVRWLCKSSSWNVEQGRHGTSRGMFGLVKRTKVEAA